MNTLLSEEEEIPQYSVPNRVRREQRAKRQYCTLFYFLCCTTVILLIIFLSLHFRSPASTASGSGDKHSSSRHRQPAQHERAGRHNGHEDPGKVVNVAGGAGDGNRGAGICCISFPSRHTTISTSFSCLTNTDVRRCSQSRGIFHSYAQTTLGGVSCDLCASGGITTPSLKPERTKNPPTPKPIRIIERNPSPTRIPITIQPSVSTTTRIPPTTMGTEKADENVNTQILATTTPILTQIVSTTTFTTFTTGDITTNGATTTNILPTTIFTTTNPSGKPTTVQPTPNPTLTTQPTPNPTLTTQPTMNPTLTTQTTENPTIQPTLNPITHHPTIQPSTNPTHNPTVIPTQHPTTQQPSENPTQQPSAIPTQQPSAIPTQRPPTNSPTLSPTRHPPTNSPTLLPTRHPPTNNPTLSPTRHPPTNNPTLSPTQHSPTNNPTPPPTQSPILPPTQNPTFSPTQSPTQNPTTNTPTQHPPTQNPTTLPTQRPPTQNPTTSPTQRPPTQSPTTSPTQRPLTQNPTFQPPSPQPNPPNTNTCTCCATFNSGKCFCSSSSLVSTTFCTDDAVGTCCDASSSSCGATGCTSYSPTSLFALPVSSGNLFDFSSTRQFCCSGSTAGIVRSQTQPRIYYILSNTHVFAPFGASPVVGQPITSPGLIDATPVCSTATPRTVARLAAWHELTSGVSHRVDAAIARLDWTTTNFNLGAGLAGIGILSPNPLLTPTIGLPVKKNGRTTSLTRGTITGLQAVISVSYSSSCASSITSVVSFQGQLVVTGLSGAFSAGGDSGSLVVTDETVRPRPVGLLFAGNTQITILNPIGDVLSRFGVEFFDAVPFSVVQGQETFASQDSVGQNLNEHSFARLSSLEGYTETMKVYMDNPCWYRLEQDQSSTFRARYVAPDSASGSTVRIHVLVSNMNLGQQLLPVESAGMVELHQMEEIIRAF